jgi:hypothetical protein
VSLRTISARETLVILPVRVPGARLRNRPGPSGRPAWRDRAQPPRHRLQRPARSLAVTVIDGRRRTDEQHRSFAELRALAGARWRVTADVENYPVIPCRYGQIEWFAPGSSRLAAYADRPRLFRRVLDLPGVRRHQIGDLEISVLFPQHVLGDMALLLRASRRRHLSSEEARRRAALRSPRQPEASVRAKGLHYLPNPHSRIPASRSYRWTTVKPRATTPPLR